MTDESHADAAEREWREAHDAVRVGGDRETFDRMTVEEAREIVAVARLVSEAATAATAVSRAFFPIAGLAAQIVEKADGIDNSDIGG